ncbi:MAG: RnfABCDGE type electron transport complex subunit C [Planctomycetia bacterium]|jgi:electron transport complex protein RnfC|nr:RnfABCDGE type electron transport complex subunit C [Planctomycetia bacterium]MCC7314041.1 RnfABCDGE type electron transport complex subunit C [Planctomycetota bacterium]OQZ05798.1 MAG: hypothetical protein B6D36_08250 [Planctomycetes bacterium UTPLA1]
MSLLVDLLGPRQGFEGGLFLPDFKSATARRPIETMPADVPLNVPLQAAASCKTRTLVSPGERVLQGQWLSAPADVNSLPVHSPVSGRIVELSRAWTARDGYLSSAVIEPDGRAESVPQQVGWQGESFMGQLANKGVFAASSRKPAHVLLQNAIASGATELIINAMETEPYLTAELRLLVEQPGRMVDMACELADAMGVSRLILAIPYRHRRVVRRIMSEVQGRHVEVVPLSNSYPQCHPIILVKTVLDREVPPGGDVLDVGAAVLSPLTLHAAADAIFSDRPQTQVVMTISGDAVEHAGTYRVPIGMPIRRLAERVGLLGPVEQMVWGGPLTGVSLTRDDAVVTIDTTAVLFFLKAEKAEPVPCIRCGWCVEDCPTGLDPSALVQLEAETSVPRHTLTHLKACIDCGLCSYVCPASLPLAASISRSRSRFSRFQNSTVSP